VPFEWALTLVLAGAAIWSLTRFSRIAAIGAAYKAKVLCSILFGTGRDIDPRRADEVSADSYWPMRMLRVHVDPVRYSVTASFMGLRPRSAVYRDGLGATLLPPTRAAAQGTAGSETDEAEYVRGRAHAVRAPAVAWPDGEGSTILRHLIESAFSEPDPRRPRRTRAVVVARDGRIVAERYASGFNAETRFSGWSMTKSVLATLIGVLVGQGRLTLRDRELLPLWKAPDARSEITLEDLLRMRSGLKFSEVYSDFSSDVIEMLFNQPDSAAYAAARPLSAPPGTSWSYASGTTNILSAIARRIVGEANYVQWPRRVLFDPVGMTSAILEPDASGTFVGSSFMLATARDWLRFGQLYLQDGVWEGRSVMPEGWVTFSTRPTVESDGAYGAHWWLKLQPEMGGTSPAAARIRPDAYFAIGHEGQTLTIIPSLRLVVVRLGLSIYVDAWNHAEFIAELQDVV
jgi:CubicO group peptidase (beta-lactamase class C family)